MEEVLMIPVNLGEGEEEGGLIATGEMRSDSYTFWVPRVHVLEE